MNTFNRILGTLSTLNTLNTLNRILGIDDVTSAPRPRRKPSANLELVLWKTHAESTDPRNFSAVSWSSVTITSVWLEPYLGDTNMSKC